MLNCVTCNQTLVKKAQKRFCSIKCQNTYYKKRKAELNGDAIPHLTTGSYGALQELRVITDLMLKGYQVFRAVSPSSTVDLLILQSSKTYRVEVTSGMLSQQGVIYHPAKNIQRFDILAIVFRNGDITYQPELPLCENPEIF